MREMADTRARRLPALDFHRQGLKLRRLLESYGYTVSSLGLDREKLVTVVLPPETTRDVITAGTVRLDVDLHVVDIDGRLIELTPLETALLRTLMLRAGETVTQRELVHAAWPGREPATCRERLHFHVFALRRKFREAGRPHSIATGKTGYRFDL